jgi:hypothetical protein
MQFLVLYQKLMLEVLKCLVACQIEMSTFTGSIYLIT